MWVVVLEILSWMLHFLRPSAGCKGLPLVPAGICGWAYASLGFRRVAFGLGGGVKSKSYQRNQKIQWFDSSLSLYQSRKSCFFVALNPW